MTTPSAYEEHFVIDAEHSMPTPEQAHTEAAIKNKSGDDNSKRRLSTVHRFYLLVAVASTSLALIIGFSIALVSSSSSRSAESTLQNEQAVEAHDESLTNFRSDSRLADVQEFLSAQITDLDVLQDSSTPQYAAARWIADSDAWNMDIPEMEDAADFDYSYEFVQRYIAAVFYFALDGKNWNRQMEFLSDVSVCDWNYEIDTTSVNGDEVNYLYGLQCDTDDDVITHIFMPDNSLSGEFPPEVADLLLLRHISLFRNNISGVLPDRLQYLKNLNFLAMDENKLSGPIPEWIVELTELKYMALGANAFTGELPSLDGLYNLKQLALDDNMLFGSIDAVNDLEALEVLFLSGNKFNSRIHDSTFDGLENLRIIDLGHNDFTGYFPEKFYFYDQVDLRSIDLSGTTLPDVSEDGLSPCTYLSLKDTGIEGEIPATFGNLENLETLDLSNNALQYMLPEDLFFDMEFLITLDLSNNDFDEMKFPDLSQNFNLHQVLMANANIVGPIHSWVPKSLENLQYLDLHDNALTGSISPSFGDLDELHTLLLNRNQLYGDIPESLGYLTGLTRMHLDNNNFDDNVTVQPVCDMIDTIDYASITADCDTVNCECCTVCCSDGDDTCNTTDPDNTYIHTVRDERIFGENIVFTKSYAD